MADENANAQNQEQSDSPSENQNAGSSAEDNAVGGSQPQSNEEQSDGGAERRIRDLSRKLKSTNEQLEEMRELVSSYNRQNQATNLPPRPSAYDQRSQYPNDEVERAFSTLKQRGMVTKEELEETLVRLEWDRQHDRNEADINRRGSNLPAYDRKEIEEHARRKGISDPMAAYRDLYWDEMMDATRRSSSKSSSNVTERPRKASADTSKQPLTVEDFRKKLQGPDGRKFYEELAKDPAKLDEMLQAVSSTSE